MKVEIRKTGKQTILKFIPEEWNDEEILFDFATNLKTEQLIYCPGFEYKKKEINFIVQQFAENE